MKNYKQLEQYYKDNRKNLVNKIKGKTGSVFDAEDVVQESFARALKFWKYYSPNRPLEGWIMGILYNALSDFKKEERMHGMPVFNEPVFDIEEIVSTKDLVRRYLKNKEEGRDKSILTLSFVKHYSDKDIADILSIKPHIVRNVLFCFRKQIKNILNKSEVLTV